MLPKSRRLKGGGVFYDTVRKGRLIKSKNFSIHLNKASLNIKDHGVKVGIVISRKVSKKAVVRNTLKRRMSEIIRPLVSDFKYKNVNIVIKVYVSAKDLRFSEIKEELEKLFKEI
ncbi:ribonuclease P protein component [Patescibacteria group bacterium]